MALLPLPQGCVQPRSPASLPEDGDESGPPGGCVGDTDDGKEGAL